MNNVDPLTLLLSRADGTGDSALPLLGPPGPSSSIGDETGAFAGAPCNCNVEEPDGIDDLLLKFRRQELADVFNLGSELPGTLISLQLTGSLFDGTPFVATDCIKVVSPDDDEDEFSEELGLGQAARPAAGPYRTAATRTSSPGACCGAAP